MAEQVLRNDDKDKVKMLLQNLHDLKHEMLVVKEEIAHTTVQFQIQEAAAYLDSARSNLGAALSFFPRDSAESIQPSEGVS